MKNFDYFWTDISLNKNTPLLPPDLRRRGGILIKISTDNYVLDARKQPGRRLYLVGLLWMSYNLGTTERRSIVPFKQPGLLFKEGRENQFPNLEPRTWLVYISGSKCCRLGPDLSESSKIKRFCTLKQNIESKTWSDFSDTAYPMFFCDFSDGKFN